MTYDPETGEVLDDAPQRVDVGDDDRICVECSSPLDTDGPRCRACWLASRRCACGASLANAPPRARACEPCRTEAKRVRTERDELRRRELAVIEALAPSLAVEGECVRRVRPRRLAESVSLDGTMLRLDRLSGRGLPGSSLVAVARDYDGLGPNGGEPHRYVGLFVAFRDGRGRLVRTQGVRVLDDELRPLAAALLAEADRLDAAKEPSP